MRSGTSSFDRTVFKKTVLRFWPVWAAYSVIWLIIMPLNALIELQMDAKAYSEAAGEYLKIGLKGFAEMTVPSMVMYSLGMAVIFGALAAMAVFSHLYNARSANLFGSLPVRREGLFVSHYLAGLSYFIVPNAVVFLLTLIVEAVGGYVDMQALLFWLGVTCGECFLFYSMAVFCAMFTGHILVLPAFYGILNVFVFGVIGLFYLTLDNFYYGFAGFSDWVYDVSRWSTPVWKLGSDVRCYWEFAANTTGVGDPFDRSQQIMKIQGLGTVGIYVLAAAVLTVCAFFLYRARRLESAGDVVAVNPMKPVFKYGVAICSGMVFGVGTYVTIGGGGDFALMAAILIWGVIGYFVAQMLLDKSFRVFKKWKGAAAVAGVFVILFLVVGFDLTGYETRVPSTADVESVFVEGLTAVNYADSGDIVALRVDDPEQIELLAALHRAAVEDRSDEWHTGASVSTRLELDYTLKNGSTLRRSYYVNVEPNDRDREGTAAWALEKLYHNTDLYWRAYGFDILEEELALGGRLDSAEFCHYDKMWGNIGDVVGYGDDARALLDAVQEDMRAGRIGLRTLADAQEHYRYDRRDRLRFQGVDPNVGGTKFTFTLEIALQDTATSTLAELNRLESNLDNERIRDEFERWLK